MRFSIFTTLPPVGRSPDQVLRDFREQVVLAEELGFHAAYGSASTTSSRLAAEICPTQS